MFRYRHTRIFIIVLVIFVSCFLSHNFLENEEAETGVSERILKKNVIASDRNTKASYPIHTLPTREWSITLPDLVIQSKGSKDANYKRTYGIIERWLSREEWPHEKITTTSPLGLSRIKKAVGLKSASTQLIPARSYPPDVQGLVTTRLNVSINETPIFGSEIIVNQRPTKNGIHEEIVKDVIPEVPKNLPTEPQINVETALGKATQEARLSSDIQDLKVKLISSRLVYFPGKKTLSLAWHLKVSTEGFLKNELPTPPGKWNYFVDSISGEILIKGNDVQTETNPAEIFQASGPGGNEGNGNDRPWDQELDVIFDADTTEYQMNTQSLVTVDLKGSEPPEENFMIVSIDKLLKLGNKVGSGADLSKFGNRALNNAHGFAEQTLNLLKELGYNSINEEGVKLPSLVNYSQDYDNAFWDGEKMVYGGGGTYFYNLASDAGVVAHEINHGFTQNHSGLFYQNESGGLNESFSDIAGATAKFFGNNNDTNFLIGEKIIKRDGPLGEYGFLRHMCMPRKDNYYSWDMSLTGSIDNYSDYFDGLDVHYSSGIMNKAFCRFARRMSSAGDPEGTATRDGVLRAARVFFDANKTKWGLLSTFRSAASGTIRSAVSLGFSEAEIGFLKDSWNDVGVEATPETFVVSVTNLQHSKVSVYESFAKTFTCDAMETECNVTVDKDETFEMVLTARKGWRIENVIGCDSFREVPEGVSCQVKVRANVIITPVIAEYSELPGAPLKLTSFVSWGIVYLNWKEPIMNGGHGIIDYTVQYSSDAGATWVTYNEEISALTNANVKGLKSGVPFIFRVAAVNSEGVGQFSSPSESLIIISKPSNVKNVIGISGDKQITLAWTRPDDDGGSPITNYQLDYYSNNGTKWEGMKTPTSPGLSVIDLTNGQNYIFYIKACNKRECGEFVTSSTLIPSALPDAPINLSGTAGDGRVTVAWDIPKDDGGSAIQDYTIQYSSNNGATWVTFQDGISKNKFSTVTGLTNGKSLVFRCAATNSVGTGKFSAPSSPIVPVGRPSSPINLIGVAGDRQVKLNWTAPINSGGYIITDYVIQYSANNGLNWVTFKESVSSVPSSIVSGLNNGTSYIFRVAAVNKLGAGNYSAMSDSINPFGVPSDPINVRGTVGKGKVLLTWSPPKSDNGSAILDYIIQLSPDNGKTWRTFEDGISSVTSSSVTGLTSKVSYLFRVRGKNAAGLGALSNLVSVRVQ